MKPKDNSAATNRVSWFPSRQRISERAYALWMEEGRPELRDLHHWLRAERELRAEHEAESGGNGSDGSLSEADIESDKRVDGLSARIRDPRSPAQEQL
jgi:hypothetical protein